MRSLLALSMLALTACAPALTMTYRSDPPGAMIYEESRALGYAPVSVPYNVDALFKDNACIMLRPIAARWVSGAVTQPTQIKACKATGSVQELTFMRPNVQGRETDVQWALHLQQQALAERQAEIAAQAAAAAEVNAVFQNNGQIHCTTSQVGTSIVTNCF